MKNFISSEDIGLFYLFLNVRLGLAEFLEESAHQWLLILINCVLFFFRFGSSDLPDQSLMQLPLCKF